jgi:hypothetical protein
MSLAILLLVLILENSEKPKRMIAVDKRTRGGADVKQE